MHNVSRHSFVKNVYRVKPTRPVLATEGPCVCNENYNISWSKETDVTFHPEYEYFTSM